MDFSPMALGHHSSLLISSIPETRNFMENHGFFMEIFMEKLGPVLDLYEISRENLWKIHGFSWIFPWKTHGTADP